MNVSNYCGRYACKLRHLVDQDDDRSERWAEVGDVAVVERIDANPDYQYAVGMERTGASGFYTADELASHFYGPVPATTVTAAIAGQDERECYRCGRVAGVDVDRRHLWGVSADGITVAEIQDVEKWICQNCFIGKEGKGAPCN